MSFANMLADALNVSDREGRDIAEGIYLRAEAREGYAQAIALDTFATADADALANAERILAGGA